MAGAYLAWNTPLTPGYNDKIMCRPFCVPLMLRAPLCLLAVLLLCAPASAQVKSAPVGPHLMSVKEIQALGAREAEARPRQVKLKGTVLFMSNKRDDLKLHDGERSIGVSIPDAAPRPKVGDLVEVEGFTNALNVQAHLYPHVVGESVCITGQGTLPEPEPVSMGALVEFKNYDQWVCSEGVVLMWTYKAPKLSLMILGQETWGVVHVMGVNSSNMPPNLQGAHVRVTGINMGVSHSAADTMIAPTATQLEVVKSGAQDIFSAPSVSMSEVVARGVPLLDRVKVKGVVTAKMGERVIYVRNGDLAICALIQHGWLRSSSSGQIYGDAGRLPVINPGDEVELVGSLTDPGRDPLRAGYALVWCHVRVTGKQAVPGAVTTTLTDITGGFHTHDLVQVKARLVNQNQLPVNHGRWRSTIMVEAEDVKLPVAYEGKERDVFRLLKVDDELMLTGVVDKETPHAPRQLWLTSAEGVRSLGMSPAVQERRLWLWGGASLVAIAVLAMWIASLRSTIRSQQQADATIREVNASLEQRVTTRTQELEQTQAELRRALEHERELGELKSRFVTMVSHEFRTPLGIIMSAVELMRHYEARLPIEQRRELYDDIYGATRLMASLMEQVLVLGRVEAGKLGCRPLPLDLDTLAGKVTDEMLSATNRRCPIYWQPQGALDGAMGDEALLRHIFSNLITNAVKYSPEGRSVELTARREGKDVVFQVIDHGIGIPPDDQARLFEAFYRCSNVGEIPGTGLGLVIVKRCVELHGGTLHLESEPGRGTTFTVRLPLFAEPQAGVLPET